MYLVTRRTSERRFFFTPTPMTVLICAYCLAVAARRHGIILHAWLFMSNHYHLVVTDPKGELPRFLELLNRLLAKALNAQWKHEESIFSTAQTSVVLLGSLQDAFNEIVYTLLNPVKAGLVERVADWPGASSFGLLAQPSSATTHDRPKVYFSQKRSSMPETASLEVAPPTALATTNESPEEWHRRIREAVAEGERRYELERKVSGRRVVGVERILKQRETDRPPPVVVEKDAKAVSPREKINPTVACKDATLRRAILRQLAEFRARHREARQAFEAGDREAVFPLGTYRMRLLGARCAA